MKDFRKNILLPSGVIARLPNKTAKGMLYTRERTARHRGGSLFVPSMLRRSGLVSADARNLSLYGTCDVLACGTEKIKRLKRKNYCLNR